MTGYYFIFIMMHLFIENKLFSHIIHPNQFLLLPPPQVPPPPFPPGYTPPHSPFRKETTTKHNKIKYNKKRKKKKTPRLNKATQ